MQENSTREKSSQLGSNGLSRIDSAPVDLSDTNQLRLGRRESEPHALELMYLFNVLSTNFPADRVTSDLHHYFMVNEDEIDLQFDISYFREFTIPYSLSSYRASDYQNRVPTLVINVLSKSTWRMDISENVDYCQAIQIPLYVVYSPYLVTSKFYRPPFLRVYRLQEDGKYIYQELREITLQEGGEINPAALIDVSDIVPFRLGLMECRTKHERNQSRYRLIFLNSQEVRLLLSDIEMAEATIQEKDRALQEKEEENVALQKELDKFHEDNS